MIARDPTSHTLRWIYTNQAAISISLWCRVLEAARRLQQDMGYATYGHSDGGLSSYGIGSKRPAGSSGYYAQGSKPSRSLNVSKTKQSKNSAPDLDDDEIELTGPTGEFRSTWHTANAARGQSKRHQSASGGIEVTQEYGYSEQSLRSGDT